ncbi:MAG: glycosyltransferase [Gammaproteobacteria bacterium]|nr:glycosyltransferase [Gammaproteobacteria bacterium]
MHSNESVLAANESLDNRTVRGAAPRSPLMFAFIFAVWIASLLWFGPRLLQSLEAARGPVSSFALHYFVTFIPVAWLYGIYNLSVVLFAIISRLQGSIAFAEGAPDTPVAVLYTTCNDFVEASALSCASLDYEHYRVYILDDSSDREIMRTIDRFAARFEHVQVVRRQDRQGFKAGNLNNALAGVVSEPLFVIADSDEILPRDFLSTLVPRINGDPNCGFIQANHRCLQLGTKLQKDLCHGVDVHWKWYQPLRNRYGFVMFLGHGAILRRSCWQQVGGFPEVVSEDLAYAIAIRERGYYGTFASDVTCFEEFPESVRSFRVRHVKWTRGTCEFLHRYGLGLLRSSRVSWSEKFDILFPTANLPVTLFFFLYMILAAIVLPASIGERNALTIELWQGSFQIPVMLMPAEMNILYTWDFFLITVCALVSPILCFILEMWRTPIRLLRFLTHSTALYAALAPLSTISVLGYALTRKARFLVTGDHSDSQRGGSIWNETHPDAKGVQRFEWLAATVFAIGAVASFQIALFGIAIAYGLISVMHNSDWGRPGLQSLVWLPFSFIATGLALGGMGLFGMQAVFFGFGFHF